MPPAPTAISTLSLHDALPIYPPVPSLRADAAASDGVQYIVRLSPLANDVLHAVGRLLDRKSTRLNSSHANISYAVFCLKKKKNHPRSYNPRSNRSGTARHDAS